MAVEPVAPTTEAQEQTTPPAANNKDDFLSPRFAALAKREKELRYRDQQIKAKEEALKAKEAEYKSSYIPKSQLTSNFWESVIDAGLNPEQVTQMVMSGSQQSNDPTIIALNKKIEALEARLGQTQESVQNSAKQAYDQALNQIRMDADNLLKNTGEYELLKEVGSGEDIAELIKQKWDEEQVLLSVEEAAAQLEEKILESGLRYASLSKVKAKLQPPQAEQAVVQEEPKKVPMQNQQSSQQQIKTLTHSATTTPSRAMSARERAILAFKGQRA